MNRQETKRCNGTDDSSYVDLSSLPPPFASHFLFASPFRRILTSSSALLSASISPRIPPGWNRVEATL
eukprot:scaffold33559_cov63-Phaeocystis_antarctica.AAC.1